VAKKEPCAGIHFYRHLTQQQTLSRADDSSIVTTGGNLSSENSGE